MKIYTPVKGASGIYANTLFVNGVGETDNENAIAYFRTHGYIVEDGSSEEVRPSYDGVDFDSMTIDELRSWMKEQGMGSKIKNFRNRERLMEIIRG